MGEEEDGDTGYVTYGRGVKRCGGPCSTRKDGNSDILTTKEIDLTGTEKR